MTSLKQTNEMLREWFLRDTEQLSTNQISSLPISLATDKGKYRNENQDRVSVLEFIEENQGPYIVCALSDGMGGMTNGADCAAVTLTSFFTHFLVSDAKDLKQRLMLAVLEANKSVYDLYKTKGGATLSALVLTPDKKICAVNVGDSRIYRSQNGMSLEQLSNDDTIAGQIQRSNDELSNELLQFMGMGDEIEPHLIDISDRDYTNLLLTSDGVHFINKGVLSDIVSNADNTKVLVRRLVEVAKWAGGKDNASVIAVGNFTNDKIDLGLKNGLVRVTDSYSDIFFERPVAQNKYNNKSSTNTRKSTNPPKPRKTTSKKTKVDKSNQTEHKDEQKAEKPQMKIEFDD